MKKESSKINKKQRGSALVLTIIVLVNALLIVTAISTISILERKMNSRTKNSTPAFQAADSGVEWVLFKIKEEDPMTTTLASVFGPEGIVMDAQGLYQCPGGLGIECEFYFVDDVGLIINSDATLLVNVDATRVVGKYGAQEEKASRAIEAVLKIANCPAGFMPIGDFCIMEDDLDTDDIWQVTALSCVQDYDARLCTAAEWIVSCQLSEVGEPLDGQILDMTDGREWTGDMTDTGDVLVFGAGNCTNNAEENSTGDTNQRRCCANLRL